MLLYKKIDVPEGIDVNKTSALKELKDIAILNVKGVDFRCILWGISRDEAVNSLNNSVLEDKGLL